MIYAKQSVQQARMGSKMTAVCCSCRSSSTPLPVCTLFLSHFPAPEMQLWELLHPGILLSASGWVQPVGSTERREERWKSWRWCLYLHPSLPDSGCFWQCQTTPSQGLQVQRGPPASHVPLLPFQAHVWLCLLSSVPQVASSDLIIPLQVVFLTKSTAKSYWEYYLFLFLILAHT